MSVSSVIAKFQIVSQRQFGEGQFLTSLSCVCENDLMAAYAGSEEDRLFTRYTGWGEAQVGALLGSGHCTKGQKLYAVFLRSTEKPSCPRARKVVAAYVDEVANIGHDQGRVEIAGRDQVGLNCRMSIDNPPAVAFFEPKVYDYWVAFYCADELTRDEALADAHA
jgi:hypothetical protein